MTYRVLAAATNHPDPLNPYFGLFNARSIEALSSHDVFMDVVVPRPYAPAIGPFSQYSQIPGKSKYNGYKAHHPRFFYGLPKRVFYGLSGRSYSKRVSQYLQEEFKEPDIVHAYHIYPDGYGTITFCENHNLPQVAVAHGAALNEFESFSRGVRRKICRTLEYCDRLLCVSNTLAERASGISSSVSTEVVPIGADPDRFPIKDNETIRASLGISSEIPVVLFCGQYIERKGIQDIIDILPSILEEDIHFLFVGQDGPLRIELESIIAEHDFQEKVDLWYDVTSETIERCFAVADLLLLPSFNEGRPTVIYEAMASETAVLATNVGGIPEQVSDGETGVLISPGDTHRLRKEVKDLCSNQNQLRLMGSAGYERLVEKGWTWEAHADRVYEIHQNLIG